MCNPLELNPQNLSKLAVTDTLFCPRSWSFLSLLLFHAYGMLQIFVLLFAISHGKYLLQNYYIIHTLDIKSWNQYLSWAKLIGVPLWCYPSWSHCISLIIWLVFEYDLISVIIVWLSNYTSTLLISMSNVIHCSLSLVWLVLTMPYCTFSDINQIFMNLLSID